MHLQPRGLSQNNALLSEVLVFRLESRRLVTRHYALPTGIKVEESYL